MPDQTPDTPEAVRERLQQFDFFADIPDDQLQWLVAKSRCFWLAEGAYLFQPGDPAEEMFICLEGRIVLRFQRHGQFRDVNTMQSGEIGGSLPYSRLKQATAYAVATRPAHLMALHRDYFQELAQVSPPLTQKLVNLMVDRVRYLSEFQQMNDKLSSLGKLSAGLAHELNNPASAMVRSAEALREHLRKTPERFRQVVSVRLPEEVIERINGYLFDFLKRPPEELGLMVRQERTDALTDWLENHDIQDAEEIAERLVEYAVTPEELDAVAAQVGPTYLDTVVHLFDNLLTSEQMVDEIHDAAERIRGLVQSIKSYSHMDRSHEKQTVDLRLGLQSTLKMMEHKIRKHQVEVERSWPEDLPPVYGNPGELNQIWTNLIDNALDAMPEGGTLGLAAGEEDGWVKVHVRDTGTGIPQDVLPNIFDPFFTTKGIDQGTGLGLDVVKKLVNGHQGQIKVDSRPGQTVFTVCFPLFRRA